MPVNQQIPNYESAYDRLANNATAVGNAISQGIGEAANQWEASRKREGHIQRVHTAAVQSLVQSKDSLGLTDDQFSTLLSQITPSENEDADAYDDRTLNIMANIDHWDKSGAREAGMPLTALNLSLPYAANSKNIDSAVNKFYLLQQSKGMEPDATGTAQPTGQQAPAGTQQPAVGVGVLPTNAPAQSPILNVPQVMGPAKPNNMGISADQGGGPPTMDLVLHRMDKDMYGTPGQETPSHVGVPNAMDASKRLSFAQDAGLFSTISQGQPTPSDTPLPSAIGASTSTPSFGATTPVPQTPSVGQPNSNDPTPRFSDKLEKTIATFSPQYQPVVRAELEALHQEFNTRAKTNNFLDEKGHTFNRRVENLLAELRVEDHKNMSAYTQHQETLANQRDINANTQGWENERKLLSENREDRRTLWRIKAAKEKAGQNATPEEIMTSYGEDLATGKLTLPELKTQTGIGAQGNKLRGDTYDYAKKKNPHFNAAEWQAMSTLASSPKTQAAIGAIDNASSNLDHFIEVSNAVKRFGISAVNKLLVSGQMNMGSIAASNYEVGKQLLADEVSLALGGGTQTDKKLQVAQTTIRSSNSPEQIIAAVKYIKAFLGNRRKQNYTTKMGPYANMYGDYETADKYMPDGVLAPENPEYLRTVLGADQKPKSDSLHLFN